MGFKSTKFWWEQGEVENYDVNKNLSKHSTLKIWIARQNYDYQDDHLSVLRCDDADGKAMDSGQKGLGFKF